MGIENEIRRGKFHKKKQISMSLVSIRKISQNFVIASKISIFEILFWKFITQCGKIFLQTKIGKKLKIKYEIFLFDINYSQNITKLY